MSTNVTFDGLPKDGNPFSSPLDAKYGGDGRAPARDVTMSTFQGSTIVPPTNKARTLVLCFDGTGDQFDNDNSNIVELFTCLAKGDTERQMVYYQAGIGTYTDGNEMFTEVSKTLDEALAWGLDRHIMDGYEFLMQNYRKGDRICIFGFSRGAYTARCLAGMIHKVGLLPACNHQQVPFAYRMYAREDTDGWKQSNAFKKAFSIDVDIEFLGVWDTVNSVGLVPRRLPFTTSNDIVRTFRHAVALDERRAKFKANTWNRPQRHEASLSITDQKLAQHAKKKEELQRRGKKDSLRALEKQYSTIRAEPTDIEEVWFAGCHCDVGGGSVSNETKTNLARISLRWMIRECFRRECGILFLVEGLRDIGLDPASLYPLVLPRPPALSPLSAGLQVQRHAQPAADTAVETSAIAPLSEEEHDLRDALAPAYDQLDLSYFWWLFELIPIRHRYQQSDDTWTSYLTWNMARGRVIPRQHRVGVKVHRSVKTRMEAEYADGQKYIPKANLDLEMVNWVE